MIPAIKNMIRCPEWQVSCERVETLHGYEVCSWYNEHHCNWEAWIKGVGGWTDCENRENAIVGILRKAYQAKQEWDELQAEPMFPQGANDSVPSNSWEVAR